jgi:thiosulfate/3-mercaptopyruvate sulfurtransferase
VPGAAYVDLGRDLADPPGDGGRHPLPEQERFLDAMRRCGVSTRQPVVVYDDVSGTSAARAWWLLRYYGHPDVRLLDGGWSWWVKEDGPVREGEEPVASGDFAGEPGHLPVLDADGAARVARTGVLIDARAPERYSGDVEPVDPVAGHIPGAVNVPTAANLIPPHALRHGQFKMLDDLSVAYDVPGMSLDADVGVYCGSGVTAAHDVFALSLLGVPAALYAGSWSGWITDPARPVARGDGSTGRE